MDYSYSKHATEQITRRSIRKSDVKKVLEHPDLIQQREENVKVFQKIIKEEKDNYLYRVFVNINKKPHLIITVYKTSKIKKYEY